MENKEKNKVEEQKEVKVVEQPKEEKKVDTKEEKKPEEKKKVVKDEIAPKTEAVVNGKNSKISTKHAIAICNFIRGKKLDKAIEKLEPVLNYKVAIPMRGEIPHRKGKIMSGRFPQNATIEFIKLLKSLRANAIVNQMEYEKYILFCKANMAARPYGRFGSTRAKRTNVTLRLIKKENKK